ncbi:MAG TPA: hydroxyacid dehydrogenase [Candidatus Saccharimonadaceae bacterium]|jgi:D-3-phosphoglycerate dehydrogenase|nr:hydroxyacid dehydrogenase [Candidatus Saccharimonadaceae bacterium]
MKVVVADRLDGRALERVRGAGHEVVDASGAQGAALIEALAGAHALLIRGGARVTGEVLRGAPTLRVVVRAGVGLDNVDLTAARRGNVSVFNTPAANAVSVAELAFGLMLALERHLVPAAASLKAGDWEKSKFMGHELAGRSLGLIGFGRVGREMALRARAFEMTVWACDPLIGTWPAGFEWVRRATLDALLAEAEVVSLHVPLSADTRHLIGPRELQVMRPDALLLNVARGGVVDETALHEALANGRLRGAALDVFANEPPGESPLLALPNVLAVPHLGASTHEAQRRAGDEAASVLLEALSALAG